MKKLISKVPVMIAVVAAIVTGCKKDGESVPPAPLVNAVIVSAAGDSAGIVAKLNEFRLLAGDPLNSAPGAGVGRREVNWDAVPPAFTNANNFPFDFFGSADPLLANGRKRGLLLTNTGTSFRVDSTDFADIDASYAAQFEAFSRKRLFAYMGNNVTEITFNVPGTNTPAFVKGFAVIFSDVDDANSTGVEYFNGNKSLGVYKAKASAQGFSLVGVGFPDEKVTRVKITCGNGLLAAGVKDLTNGGTKDLVVMDDFIYDEPKAN
jgi:hypothetical protein